MRSIGPWELIIILILVVIIFGSRRLPGWGRALGRGLASLRAGPRPPAKKNADPEIQPPGEAGDMPGEVQPPEERAGP